MESYLNKTLFVFQIQIPLAPFLPSHSMPELPSNPPPSVRFELLNTAVNFLSDPAVAASPLSRRLAFLEQKGLTPQEIELALARTQRPRELISEQTQIQAEKPFNWRGLAIGSGAVLATALLIHQNLDVFKVFPRLFWQLC